MGDKTFASICCPLVSYLPGNERVDYTRAQRLPKFDQLCEAFATGLHYFLLHASCNGRGIRPTLLEAFATGC
jgi:hypothetical protein